MTGFNHVLWEMPQAPITSQPNQPARLLAQVAQRDNETRRRPADSPSPLRERMKRRLKFGKPAPIPTTKPDHTAPISRIPTVSNPDSIFDISTLPTCLIASIYTYLNASSILALRSTNRAFRKKTNKHYIELFSSVKIALTPRSLVVLEALTLQNDIASEIKHVTIGTETLNQYLLPMQKQQSGDTNEAKQERQRQFEAGVVEETEGRTFMIDALKHCLLRLPALEDITIEDRPVPNFGHGHRYRGFLGSSHISRLTGLDFSWNGPYGIATHDPSETYSFLRTGIQDVYPAWSRKYTFIAVFIVLRELRILGTNVSLDMKLGGYLRFEGDEKATFAVPFKREKKMVRDVMRYHARNMEIRGVETEGWAHELVNSMG